MRPVRERFLMGMLTGAGSMVVRHLLNILLLPILIHLLGVETFGLYILLIGLLEIMVLLDLGMTDAMVKLLAEYRGAGDGNRYTGMLKTAHGLFVILALVILTAGLSLSPMFPVVFGWEENIATLAQVAIVLVILEGGLTLYATYYKAVLLSHCLHQWNHIAETAFYLLLFTFGILALWLGYGLEGLLAIRLMGAVFWSLLVVYQARRAEDRLFHPAAVFRFSELRELVRQTGHAMMVNLSVIVSHKLDTLVIALFLPLTLVSYYEVVFRLLGSALQLCLKMGEGIFPLFAGMYGGAQQETARRLFLRMSCFNHFLIGGLLVPVILFYPRLFHFFSAGRMNIEQTLPLLVLAVPIIWSSALQIPACYFLYTSGHQQFLTVTSLAAAAANLLLSLVLVQFIGLAGVAIGTLVPQLVQHQLGLIPHSCRHLSISFRDYFLHVHLKVWVLLGIYGLTIHGLSLMLPPQALVGPMAISALCLLLAALFWFLWTAGETERQFVREKIMVNLSVMSVKPE